MGYNRPFSVGSVKGSLKIIGKAGKSRGFILWECLCDCGSTCTRTTGQLQRSKSPNCRSSLHKIGEWYPPTPSPYPKSAADIASKYLKLAQRFPETVEYQDTAIDRLMRHSWIVAYRRSIGRPFADESAYMRKCLRLRFNHKPQTRVKFELKHESGSETPMKECSETYQNLIKGETIGPIKTRFRRC